MNFFAERIFLTELNFLKGDTNIYFKQITFFEKKRVCKNHTYFFLKNIYFFQLSFATFEQPYPFTGISKKSKKMVASISNKGFK